MKQLILNIILLAYPLWAPYIIDLSMIWLLVIFNLLGIALAPCLLVIGYWAVAGNILWPDLSEKGDTIGLLVAIAGGLFYLFAGCDVSAVGSYLNIWPNLVIFDPIWRINPRSG